MIRFPKNTLLAALARWLPVFILFGGLLQGAVTRDANGWTQITPSSDSRIVYVSSSQGNDSNNGLSPSTPKKTIGAGNALIRDGYPDHLLLKRGDVFPVEGANLLGRWKNGRNANEPMVMSYYGSSGARPVIKISEHLIDHNAQTRNYQAFIGLDVYKSNSDPDSPDFTDDDYDEGMRFVGGGANLLVEDCRLRFNQMSVQSFAGTYTDFELRRCIITDTWAHGTTNQHVARPQGIYVDGVDGILIEENTFDHNGWNENFADANANQYNHNIYMATNNSGPITVRGNILSRGAAHGLQLRSGGTAERNFFVRNAIGMNAGYQSFPTSFSGQTYVRDNVISEGRPQIPNDFTGEQTGALWGIWKQSINNYNCDDNIVANIYDDRGGNVYPYAGQSANQYGSGNIAWNWVNNNVPSSDPGWLDPTRTSGDYHASIGQTGTFEAYVSALRNRPLGEYPWDYTAYAVINYIRAGFNKSAVAGYYNYPGTQTVSVTGVTVTPSSASLSTGSTISLNASITPSNATNQTVSWSSSNQGVATVNSAGVASGVGDGTATITATTADGSFTDTSSVTVTTSGGGGTNVALNQSVTASAFQDDSFGYQPPSRLVDGSTTDADRWSADGFPQWAVIDLGGSYSLTEIRLYPYQDRAYQYTVEVSANGSSYSTIVNRSGNTTGGNLLTDTVSATGRYVRLTVSGASGYGGTWVSINELEVIGSSNSVPVTAVVLTPSTISLEVGQTQSLSAAVSPSNASDQGVSWSSSNSSIASVSSSGVVTGVSVGTGSITVTTDDGNYTDSSVVIISAPSGGGGGGGSETFASLNASTSSFDSGSYTGDNGETWTFVQTKKINSGISGVSAELRRNGTSELETVLTDGLDELTFTLQTKAGQLPSGTSVRVEVNGVSQGTFGVSATDTPQTHTLTSIGATGNVTLTFVGTGWGESWIDDIEWDGGASTIPVTGVTISPGTVSLMVTETEQLSASVSPSNATNQGVSWSSSNSNVATVNASGLVTAIAAGSATITGTTDDGSYTDTTSVTVTAPSGGSESFASLNASTSSFDSGSFTGDNGETWTFVQTKKINSGINGISAELRRNGTSELETIIPDGLSELTFTLQTKAGQLPSGTSVRVEVNGVSQGNFGVSATDNPVTHTISNIGASGSVTLTIIGTGWGETWIDDIEWQ
jgi:uncharacterized protein YjdB